LGKKHNSCTPKTLLYGSSEKVYGPQVDAPAFFCSYLNLKESEKSPFVSKVPRVVHFSSFGITIRRHRAFGFFPKGITTKTPRHKEERKERQWSFLGSIHLGTKHNSCTPKTLLYGSSQKVYDPQVDAPDLDGISSGIISLK